MTRDVWDSILWPLSAIGNYGDDYQTWEENWLGNNWFICLGHRTFGSRPSPPKGMCLNEIILISIFPPISNLSLTPGTYKTLGLPCGIRVAGNSWPVKMVINITSSGWPQGGLFPWGLQGTRAMWRVPLTPHISLFGLLYAPSAPLMTVANHWLLAEIVLPSKFSG